MKIYKNSIYITGGLTIITFVGSLVLHYTNKILKQINQYQLNMTLEEKNRFFIGICR